MAEARQLLTAMSDESFEAALRDLGSAIAYPALGSVGNDVASRVRERVAVEPLERRRPGQFGWIGARKVRRSFVVAIAALLILAAVAGAVVLGVPGIRIQFGGPTPPAPAASPPSTRPSATPSELTAVGQALGLGTKVSLDDAERLAQLDLVLPPDPAIGPPDAAYVFANRVALVWGERPGLPADPSSGVALLINEFRGTVDEGYYTKVLDSNATVTPVTVGESKGYWISGSPHFFFYRDPTGKFVDETAREVGDALIWNDGEITYRLESLVGMDGAIQIAESLR